MLLLWSATTLCAMSRQWFDAGKRSGAQKDGVHQVEASCRGLFRRTLRTDRRSAQVNEFSAALKAACAIMGLEGRGLYDGSVRASRRRLRFARGRRSAWLESLLCVI